MRSSFVRVQKEDREMSNFLIKSALSLALGLTGLPVLAGGASAQDVEFSIGRGGPQVRLREACDPEFNDCYENQRYVYQPVSRGCTTGRALRKADRMGIDRPRIVSAGRRTIEIRGRDEDGDRVYVTFSRQPGCPVLDY
jgi:hypothetical protein